MDKSTFSERNIFTKCITPSLVAAGWNLETQIREEVGFTKGRIFAAWHEMPAIRKLARLSNHIEWAAPHGVLESVAGSLRGLREEEWHYVSE